MTVTTARPAPRRRGYYSADRTRPALTWADKGVPSNRQRDVRVTASNVGAFSKGDRARWGECAGGIVPRRTVGLAERLPVETMARPWRDLPDPAARPDTDPTDGTVLISGRFKVKSVVAATPGTGAPESCTECWMITCECGKW